MASNPVLVFYVLYLFLMRDWNIDLHARAELDLGGNCPPEFGSNKFIGDPISEIFTVAQPNEPLLVICKPTSICCECRIRDYDAKLKRMGCDDSTEVADHVRAIRSIPSPMVLHLCGSQNWKGATIPEKYIYPAVLSIRMSSSPRFKSHY